jgi:hypothetical protein
VLTALIFRRHFQFFVVVVFFLGGINFYLIQLFDCFVQLTRLRRSQVLNGSKLESATTEIKQLSKTVEALQTQLQKANVRCEVAERESRVAHQKLGFQVHLRALQISPLSFFSLFI